jgi:hypothetical protein
MADSDTPAAKLSDISDYIEKARGIAYYPEVT